MACHQLGNKATREIPVELGEFDSLEAAWDRRIQSGQAGGNMVRGLGNARAGRGPWTMFADWTERITAGELPPATAAAARAWSETSSSPSGTGLTRRPISMMRLPPTSENPTDQRQWPDLRCARSQRGLRAHPGSRELTRPAKRRCRFAIPTRRLRRGRRYSHHRTGARKRSGPVEANVAQSDARSQGPGLAHLDRSPQ